MKFIIVSGGVLSGVGKGITTASIGLLLKSHGLRVTAIKCDMYLNIDAGTMNPIEHGEVFVTHDGLETDQDLGHYERFLDATLTRANYLTNGQIYQLVLDQERSLTYQGKCVQPYHHIPGEIIEKWKNAGKTHRAQVVIVELGGTAGEYEGLLFFEAARRLKLERPDGVCFVHVGYLPAPPSIGELKSKPLQQSVGVLNSLGVPPDFIVARAEGRVDNKRKEKIALASNLYLEDIFSAPDVDSIYQVPSNFKQQNMDHKILGKLKFETSSKAKNAQNLQDWTKLVKKTKKAKQNIKIAMVGKYQKTGDYMLEDSYVCVVEALKHAAWQFNATPELVWIDSEDLAGQSNEKLDPLFKEIDAILVPQGWGSRGTEGKIRAAQYARENNIPYLGLCFGMQMATIEFARHAAGFTKANSEEVDSKTPDPVIHIMPDQKKYLAQRQYGGTIRLGAWPCKIKPKTRLAKIYKKFGADKASPWYIPNPAVKSRVKPKPAELIFERHRHRYEFNNQYRKKLEQKGLIFSGTSPDGKLVEAIELSNHPFFIGTQFHPEYLSRPLRPHPIFLGYVESILGHKKKTPHS